ncbi:tRNA (adenosine(37)-N6)-threonylcarbamoyltransferase complex dimerization subunit type 1 TsaB [candidate division KSB1 bacterium]|nr:tRNA (adenosine(37)-N6)-threonylcarbamoyltransferase complex dimerization subunit type 1 TsaB [candidate division KSB1 bacterium]
MVIVGIETSTRICAVALTRAQQLVAEYRLNRANAHATALVDLLSTMLKQVSVALTELDAIAVSIGPGSFTGLRIGLSTAKGIALGCARPLVTVPTMDALASQAPIRDGIICPLLKARANEYYFAVYHRDNFVDSLVQEIQLVRKEMIASTLPAGAMLISPEDIGCDSGIATTFVCAPESFSMPTAFSIARLGQQKLMVGDIASLETVEPLYFQEFIAGAHG